jgi:hypothetical protein
MKISVILFYLRDGIKEDMAKSLRACTITSAVNALHQEIKVSNLHINNRFWANFSDIHVLLLHGL